MSKTIKVQDVIAGSLGRVYATIDGDVEDMIYVKNVEAIITKDKKEIPVLGQTGKKHKAGSWTGKGTMKMYYSTSAFRKLMLQYVKTGKDTYFSLVIENDDPTSEMGKQTVLLKGVNIDSVVMTKLDIQSPELDEELKFTFNDVEILDYFSKLVPDTN